MKQPLLLKKIVSILVMLLIGMVTYGQSYVSGVINDSEGLPLPGVNIIVKGTTTGVNTDFDGKYRIKCNVGDILVISYIGQQTREVKVTNEMFGEKQFSTTVTKIPVKAILDSSYQKLVRKNLPSFLRIPNIEESSKTHDGDQYLNVQRIKSISKVEDKVKITYFGDDVYFEVGISSLAGYQFVKQNNLPEIQNTFAQGIPINGINTHLGPETNTSFSFGPRIQNLEFDGTNYPYDTNGRLVANTGNGNAALLYDNNPFEAVLKTSNNVFFNVSTNRHYIGFDYQNKSGKDIYNVERSSLNEYGINYYNTPNSGMQWKVLLKHVIALENQPNINGFQNNLLLNALATPISFANNQGATLQNGNQRSFSPTNFNNPNWLLNNNRNQQINSIWLADLQNEFYIADDLKLRSKVNYTFNNTDQEFGVLQNTVGFLEGYSSDKLIEKDVFDATLTIDWKQYISGSYLKLISSFNYNNENLEYQFTENSVFDTNTFNNPVNSLVRNRNLNRGIFKWHTKIDYSFLDNNADVSLVNNSFSSTKQNNKWFLPTVHLKYEFNDIFRHSDFIRRLNLAVSYGQDINYVDLFYSNQSHNSLQLTPEDSFSYTANNDLFASNAIDLEEKESYELSLNLGFSLFNKYWSLDTTYYTNTTNGSVFPVWNANEYQLQNVANIQDSGIEWSFEGNVYKYNEFRFTPKLIFSTYRTKVLDLLTEDNSIPIAGFSSVSKNLIKGEPAGVILGSSYVRDSQNNIVSDINGIPLVNTDLQIIGDPTPEFNLGFSSTLEWKKFQLDFVLDYQKGGDVWNGTQNVLNYLGTSQQSALARDIDTSFFDTVQRNGFEGIAEDAIVDGSYLNFKSINLSYTFQSDNSAPLFRQFKVGLYSSNLFTISKFQGASPYRNLFDQTSSQGLNFFNSPIISEVGLKINIKI